MKTIVLNGGNYGGQSIVAPAGAAEGKIVIEDASKVRWCYDLNLNAKTPTAEFVVCDVAAYGGVAACLTL